MTSPYALLVYTDGSCLPNPRRGGIGIRIVFPDFMNKEDGIIDFDDIPGYLGATNQQMELKAVIRGLEEVLILPGLGQIKRIIIKTDSTYVTNNYQKALFEWSKARWIKRDGAPVVNADLWEKFFEIVKKLSGQGKRVEAEWIKGH